VEFLAISTQPFADLLSCQFMGCYLDALDGSHLLFLRSDVDEFGWFRPKLAQMTGSEGDTWPAHLIYTRFLERLAQQVNFETNVLQTAKFDFTRPDSWQPDRHDSKRRQQRPGPTEISEQSR
jgi:carboxyl-terminal processing protease